jgi:hypothetical protein
LEVNELTPSLMNGLQRPTATSTIPGVEAGAWLEEDGGVVVLVVNTLGDPVPQVELTVGLPTPAPTTPAPPTDAASDSVARGEATNKITVLKEDTAQVLFGSAYRRQNIRIATTTTSTLSSSSVASVVTSATATIVATMDGMSTRAYRIGGPVAAADAPDHLPAVVTLPTASNLVFNPGMERCTNVGTPDGWWAAWGGDGSATALSDTAVVRRAGVTEALNSKRIVSGQGKDNDGVSTSGGGNTLLTTSAATGRTNHNGGGGGGGGHSLRITTPTPNAGLRVWSFPIKASLIVGSDYALSFWARAAGTKLTLTVGMEALFGKENVTCPNGDYGQCSYTPQPVTLLPNEWKQFKFVAECGFQPDHTGYVGAAGMVSFELLDAGVAWLDDVHFALANLTTKN